MAGSRYRLWKDFQCGGGGSRISSVPRTCTGDNGSSSIQIMAHKTWQCVICPSKNNHDWSYPSRRSIWINMVSNVTPLIGNSPSPQRWASAVHLFHTYIYTAQWIYIYTVVILMQTLNRLCQGCCGLWLVKGNLFYWIPIPYQNEY